MQISMISLFSLLTFSVKLNLINGKCPFKRKIKLKKSEIRNVHFNRDSL